MNEDKEVVIDTKLLNKFYLHKFIANGGSIKLNNFGVRIVYNDQYPNNPSVELRIFAIPVGTMYKGNVNPSMVRATDKQNKKDKSFTLTENDEIEM